VDLDPIFLALLFVVWAGLGAAAWLAVAIVHRGRGVLAGLPLAMAGGIGAGVLVPALGADNEAALLLSLVTAVLGGLILSLVGIRIQSRMRSRG
jgi:uncharacterized membrane protein YeaQ/YmgE (transglycosylase-associated protein family)